MIDERQVQLDQLRQAMVTLEGQRAVLGDAAVDAALEGLRQHVAALEDQIPSELQPVEERRVVTILFTDIVGSTALAGGLDPEEWRQTVAALHATVGTIIQQRQGTVVQYLGDGLLALFGAQGSNEHDTENAVRAALDAQGSVASLNTHHSVQIRIGIHTGLVVVGDLGSDAKKEFTATGDAMNLAARLQSAAPAGGILISQDSYRYVRGVFDVTPQPPLSIKGKQEATQTYLVRRAKPRPFRRVARGVAGIQTRTVGRDAELRKLQAAYQEAFDRKSVVWAQLVGEAGVGKSRLLDDLREWVELRPETVRLLRARAYAEDAREPFALIRRMWFDRFQIAEDAPLAQAEAKWVEGFQEFGKSTEIEPAHALGLLVGLPFADSPFIGAMRDDPAQIKGRGLVVSRELLRAIRREYTIEMLLEDLQWADASSWEYLTEVVLAAEPTEDPHAHGMYILAAARPEWTPPRALGEHSGYLHIDLPPLSDEASRELTGELLQRVEEVPDEILNLIVDRSEGVPYFAEEMVNWFLDRGIIDRSREPWRFLPARLRDSPLPATLQHLLLTRLSALNDAERAALQRGAIFGRNFWAGGLAALGVRQPDATLRPLQPRGFVDAQPESSFEGETEWSFHHTLLRDVTYESVLRRERAALHRAAAGWLEEQASRAGRLDEFAGLLGEHTERAGEMSAAADWYVRAGERAMGRGAVSEAKGFFERALDLLPPIDHERRWRALIGREETLGILGKAEERSEDLTALLALARQLDDGGRIAQAHYRAADHAWNTGDYRATLQAAEHAMAAARQSGDSAIEVQAMSLKGRAQMRLGDMNGARRTGEEALVRAQELDDEPTLMLALGRLGGTHGESGHWGRNVELYVQAVELARRLGNRQEEGGGLNDLGYAYVMLGQYKRGRAALEQALRLAEATGNRRTRAYALQNLGLAYFRADDGRSARRVLEQSLTDLEAIGDTTGYAFSQSYLALVLEHLGDTHGAMRRYEESRKILIERGVQAIASDALAGLARCALAQGRLDEAREHAVMLWNYLHEPTSKGMERPVWAYQTCVEVFEALGEGERARAATQEGHRELMDQAGRLSDPEWRKSFLENVPEHRAMIGMWDRMREGR